MSQSYLSAEAYSAANRSLIEAQAGIALAQAWGGGLVAAIDGMRFVVPVPSIYAHPNRKYFGPKRGVTWLNMINDQAAGLGAKVVSGTARDSLHMIDVIFAQDGGRRPEIIVADTGSYSDVVFGLVHLLGMEYRPALADLPDQKLWRVDLAADYGPLNTAARGRIDLARLRRHWGDILRVVASVHTGAVAAYDVIRMLSRDGSPTPLGEAIASYGSIFKSLHVLAYADDEGYRRDIKGIRNLQEGRHSLAGAVFVRDTYLAGPTAPRGPMFRRPHRENVTKKPLPPKPPRRRHPRPLSKSAHHGELLQTIAAGASLQSRYWMALWVLVLAALAVVLASLKVSGWAMVLIVTPSLAAVSSAGTRRKHDRP